ncbi:MAG TPA: addiction module toxin, HicA family [Anaerolineales bacterium]|nr:addiction module toxin, HicA family [Anaerolineales bacterium]
MDGFQRLPRITGEELVKALQKAGFEIARRKGGHVQLRKVVEGRKITFPVPVHKGKILKPGTLRGILRLAGLSVTELEELLRR